MDAAPGLGLGRVDRMSTYSAAALATASMLSIRGLFYEESRAARASYPAACAVALVQLTSPIILRFGLLVLGLRKPGPGSRRPVVSRSRDSEIGEVVEALPGPFHGGVFDWTSACLIYSTARGVGFSSTLSSLVGVAFGIVNVM